MKRIYIILFTVILLFGSTLTIHAEESSFEDAHSLVSYWRENNLTPDYFCGCWYENGNEDCLIVAVKETEEGELGKQEILVFLLTVMLLAIVGFKRRQLVAKYINGRDIVRNHRLSKREIENFVKMNTSVSLSKEVDDRILNGLNHLEIRMDENKKTTKKKTFFVKTVLAVSVFGVLIGGIIHNYRNGEPVSDASSSSYAYRSLEEMVDEATYIFEGRVVKVQENRNRRTLGIHRDQNGKLRIVINEYYVTPIKLEVKQDIKGNIWKKTFTYYKEVSLSENQNALLKGPVVKEGMEFILFLDKDRYDFGGGQGISMVFGDKVSASCLYDYLDDPESVFEVMDVDEIDSTVWDVRGMREISVVNKEYYISVIQSVMNDKESNKPKEIVGDMFFYLHPIKEAPYCDLREIEDVGGKGVDLDQKKVDSKRLIFDRFDS